MTGLRRLESASIEVPEGGVSVLGSHHAQGFEMDLPFYVLCWVAVAQGAVEGQASAVLIQRDNLIRLLANWAHHLADNVREILTLVILCISEKY